MRVVECGAAGDCIFLVFAFFIDFEILEILAPMTSAVFWQTL
jgi:hypothetical protein